MLFNTNKINQLKHQFWLLWFLILAIIFSIHYLTIAVSPLIWQDEVQIIDFGRTFLEPDTDWSIIWDTSKDRPFLVFYYLGCFFQELAFRVAHFSVVGPRTLTLIGASIAATNALGWFSARGIPRKIAALLGLILLLDPLFAMSYRGDRLDAWVFALGFGACWLLRIAIRKIRAKQSVWLPLMAAGSLCAIAFFIWASAVLFYPLIGLELATLLYVVAKEQGDFKKSLQLLFGFIFAGVITGLILLIPISDRLGLLLSNFTGYTQSITISYGIMSSVITLFSTFKYTPILLICSLLGLVCCRDKGLIVACVLALTLIFYSNIYIYRILYSLPYLLTLLSEIYRPNQKTILEKIKLKIKILPLILTLGFAVSFSLVFKPIVGLENLRGRDPSFLTQVATTSLSSLNQENSKIWDWTWVFYPAGRELSWKMYYPLYRPSDGFEQQESSRLFMGKLDYLIRTGEDESYQDFIAAMGFKLQKSIPSNEEKNSPGLLSKLTGSLGTATHYGPFKVYYKSNHSP